MDTHKELYKLLQCIHHLEKTDQKELPKAFTKKQNELKRFLKPAQISDSFIKNYQTTVSKFIKDSVSALNNHYEARISETLGYLRSSRIPSAILQTGSRIALRWARRNFGKKLTNRTVDRYHQIVKTIAPSPDPSTSSPPAPDTPSSPAVKAPHRRPLKPHSTPTTHQHTPTIQTTTPNTNIITSQNTNSPHTDSHSNTNSPQTDSHSNPTSPRASYSSVVRETTTSSKPPTPHHDKTPTRGNLQSSPHSNTSSPSTSQTLNSQHNVQGHTDPLSNFFPFPFRHNQNIYISAEHAYQHKKAEHYEDFAAGVRVQQAPTAAEARKVGKDLDRKHHYHIKGRTWDSRKKFIMEDILCAKSEQCEPFRKALIETGDKLITHHVQDQYWGTTYQEKGKTMEGDNIFAQLLFKIRNKLLLSHRNKPKQGLLPTPRSSRIPAPVRTSNRFSPLGEQTTDTPDTPDTPDSPDSPELQPSKRRRLGSPPTEKERVTTVGPQIMVYRDRSRWKLPAIKSRVVVIGDSNINRATNVETEVRSIEFHSFPGAKLKHFQNLLSPSLSPQDTPKAVILSIGMNNRTGRRPNFEPELKSVIQNASKFFPNASIHIPLINIPPELAPHQQTNLNEFNRLLLALSKQLTTFGTLPKELQTFKTLPKLPQKDFKIDPRDTAYKVHWSEETANAILSHWTSNLN